MIESTVCPRFGGDSQNVYPHELPLTSPASQTNQAIVGSAGNNNYSAPNGACLPFPQVQNGFYGANMYAGQSDSTSTSSPDIFTYNPAMIGSTPGLSAPRCINGIEPSPHYPTASPVYDIKNGQQELWPVGYGQPSPYPHDGAFAPHFPYGRYSAIDFDESVRRKNATRESTNTLKSWLQEHKKNPYPTKGEKIMLAIITKMTLTQVSTWFANARRRLKKENKMTWVPKNRSSDASNNSGSKKGNDDNDGDDDSDEDDNEESLSKSKDQRITSRKSDELVKKNCDQNLVKNEVATKLRDKQSLKATKSSRFSANELAPHLVEDVSTLSYPLASPKRINEKSSKHIDESVIFNNFHPSEKSKHFYEQASFDNSLDLSEQRLNICNRFTSNSDVGLETRQSVQLPDVTSNFQQVTLNSPSLVKPHKVSCAAISYQDSPEHFYSSHPQISASEMFLQSPTTLCINNVTNSLANFNRIARSNSGLTSYNSQNQKITTALSNGAHQPQPFQQNLYSNNKYSYHSHFQLPNSFDRRDYADPVYRDQQPYC